MQVTQVGQAVPSWLARRQHQSHMAEAVLNYDASMEMARVGLTSHSLDAMSFVRKRQRENHSVGGQSNLQVLRLLSRVPVGGWVVLYSRPTLESCGRLGTTSM